MSAVALPKAMGPLGKARIAGLLYVVCIAAGFCAEFFARGAIVDYRNAALTAQNILAAPVLYRMGFFADLVSFTSGILIAIIFYDLFKVVSRPVARTALTFAIVSNTVSIAASIFCYAPLHILGADYLHEFEPAQRESLALLCLRLYQFAFSINLGLFSMDCFATAYLIARSTFLPRALGYLLAAGGFCYLFNSIVYFLPPNTLPDFFPYIYLPSLVAEASIAVWLSTFGLNAAKWHALENARALLEGTH